MGEKCFTRKVKGIIPNLLENKFFLNAHGAVHKLCWDHSTFQLDIRVDLVRWPWLLDCFELNQMYLTHYTIIITHLLVLLIFKILSSYSLAQNISS